MDFQKLLSVFERINKKGFIKGIYNNISNGSVLTIRYLLSQEGININTSLRITSEFSRRPIMLFKENVSSNIKKELLNSKITLSFTKVTKYNDHNFLLSINYSKQQIYLKIYDNKMMLVETIKLIDFCTIVDNLKCLNFLCLVYVKNKIIKKEYYFKYIKIECFKFLSFNKFLNSLIESKVKITLDGKNNIIIFCINKKDMLLNYRKIYSYENE